MTNRRIVNKAQRPYEVVASIVVGRQTHIAIAVIENGQAVWTSGRTHITQVLPHLQKLDAVLGVYRTSYAAMTTATAIIEAENAGCYTELSQWQDEVLQSHYTSYEEMCSGTLLSYLKKHHIPHKRHTRGFNVKFLERMRLRTGVVVRNASNGID